MFIHFEIHFQLTGSSVVLILGSREFGEGDEFGDEPQGVNTLNREHRDYEKRTKPRKPQSKKGNKVTLFHCYRIQYSHSYAC